MILPASKQNARLIKVFEFLNYPIVGAFRAATFNYVSAALARTAEDEETEDKLTSSSVPALCYRETYGWKPPDYLIDTALAPLVLFHDLLITLER